MTIKLKLDHQNEFFSLIFKFLVSCKHEYRSHIRKRTQHSRRQGCCTYLKWSFLCSMVMGLWGLPPAGCLFSDATSWFRSVRGSWQASLLVILVVSVWESSELQKLEVSRLLLGWWWCLGPVEGLGWGGAVNSTVSILALKKKVCCQFSPELSLLGDFCPYPNLSFHTSTSEMERFVVKGLGGTDI